MQNTSFVQPWSATAARVSIVGAGDGVPLTFAFWDVQPAIVIDNVARFATETGEHVACIEVGGDYWSTLQRQFAAGAGPDVFYAQRAEASFWAAAGHIEAIPEADRAFAPMLSRMDRQLVDGARDRAGALLGLTYYNGGPFALYTHRTYVEALAADDLTSWESVLDALRRIKRDRLADHPFVPRWHDTQTGLMWSLLCHLATEGVISFDQPETRDVLEAALAFFAALSREELIPHESLADTGDSAALTRWLTGRHSLTFTTDYLARDAAEAAGIAVNVIAPRLPGRTGTPLMPGHALLCVRSGLETDRRARARRLVAYLGGAVPDGTLRVHARWLSERLFAVPYPELDGQPAIRQAMATAFPKSVAEACVQRLLEARRMARVSPATHMPWFLDWSSFCDTTIRDLLLRRETIAPFEAADRLLEEWFRLAAMSA